MLYQLTTPGLSVNTYLIVDPLTRKAAVIDPIRDVEPLMRKLKELGVNVAAILETHVHADFVSGSKELKHRLMGAPSIFCSGLAGKQWIPSYADVVVEDRREINLGSIRLQSRHTPGHTPEHLMWLVFDDSKDSEVPVQALTGDFLFVGSVGRPDLLGEKAVNALSTQLYQSVFDILPQLPGTLEIYPAHGAGSLCGKGISPKLSSTMAAERESNPFLKQRTKNEWVRTLMENMPPSPDYFSKMKQINIKGPKILKDLEPEKKMSAQEISLLDPRKELIIDIRDKENFAARHLPGSVNIGTGSFFLNWASMVIPEGTPVFLIAENLEQIKQSISQLRLVGIDSPISYTIWDESMGSGTFPLISSEDLFKQIQTKPEDLTVVDVRSQNEWNSGHIQGAKHITIKELRDKLSQIPKEKMTAVICGSGYRASIGASLLEREGYHQVCNVKGGMQEWVNKGFPTTL